MKHIDIIYFLSIAFFASLFLIVIIVMLTRPVPTEQTVEVQESPAAEEVPAAEVVIEFILREPQQGEFATRYAVYRNGTRVGSVHTEQLTPGIYFLEVE